MDTLREMSKEVADDNSNAPASLALSASAADDIFRSSTMPGD